MGSTQTSDQNSKRRGFTIVELLIVIVVIGILAAITIVAYGGIQSRARDSARKADISTLKKALEIYKLDNGRFPAATSSQPVYGGWELSTDTAGTFIEGLKPSISKVPIDPLNSMGTPKYVYWYYRYSAGSFGCSSSLGGFYVLRVQFESSAPPSQITPCTTGLWGENYIYIQFENQ